VAPEPSPTRTLPFFIGAFGICAAALLPTILAQRGAIPGPPESYMPLMLFAVFSPTIAAMLVSRFEPGGAGLRAVLRPLRNWRVRAGWYLVALLLPGTALFVGTLVYRLAGGTDVPGWVFPPTSPERYAALVMIPIGEEIGWRGFALPRLQQRYSRLAASQLLAVGWALWHVPMFAVQGITPDATVVLALVLLFPGSIVFSWLHNRTGGALPIAIVAHVGIHLNNPAQFLPGNATPLYIHVVALMVLAMVLMADRGAWRAPADHRHPRESGDPGARFA
jgi:uncharacterized protein